MRFTVRSAFIAPSTFSECEGSRLGGTVMVYMVFSKFVISKHTCIHLCMMASGEYEPIPTDETKDNEGGRDNEGADDSKDEVDRTHPFQPTASSTPYHGVNRMK